MKEDYKKYLDSVDWKLLRVKAFQRANFKCELCGEPATECHHIKYPKNLKDDSIENLLVCCKSCHEKQHGIRDGGEALLRRTIHKRIELPGWRDEERTWRNYEGFNMTGNRDDGGIESCRIENWNLFQKFKDYMPNKFSIKDFKLWAWKGMIWWGEENCEDNEEEFGGWATEDIIFWIIQNYGKYRRLENTSAFKKFIHEKYENLEKELNKRYCQDCNEELVGETFWVGTEDNPLEICEKCAGKKEEEDDDSI